MGLVELGSVGIFEVLLRIYLRVKERLYARLELCSHVLVRGHLTYSVFL